MQRQRVASSHLAAVGYDAARRLLEIEFLGGSVYQYSNVPPNVHQSLMTAASHGSYFHAHIRGRFPYNRIG